MHRHPNSVRVLQRHVYVLVLLGEIERASEEAVKLLAMQPDFTQEYIDATYPFRVPGERDAFLDALTRAGLLADDELGSSLG